MARVLVSTTIVATVASLSLVGVLIVTDAVLLTMRLPVTAAGRAWRVFGITVASTGLLVGVVGSVALLVLDRGQAAALDAAVVYGMLLVVPGAVLGALVGSVLWVDAYRREVALG
jgi:hypothetical protein